MYVVFYSTNDVFKAEALLKGKNVECSIVPTPVTDKAYCGVCVKTDKNNKEQVGKIIKDMEYCIVE